MQTSKRRRARPEPTTLGAVWRLPWSALGLCAQVGPFLFDEVSDVEEKREPGRRSLSFRRAEKRRAQARRLCQVCPVFEQCATHALSQGETYGVWAGLSSKQRKRLINTHTTLAARVAAAAAAVVGVPPATGGLSVEEFRASRVRRARAAAAVLQVEERGPGSGAAMAPVEPADISMARAS